MLCASLFRNDPRMICVPAGTTLFNQGDRTEMMFVLIQGQARILVNGREVEQLAVGDPVGEMSLIDQEPHSASVEAVTDCEFICVDQQHFNFLVGETPGFALDLMRTMAKRLRAADRLL
jgi:CRP/FNR family cyclic AMP-dependent transcriptional regulator